MNNIIKIHNGFILNDTEYMFDESGINNTLSDTQSHVYTTDGIILLDLSCSIEGVYFDNINSFLADLYI